MTNPNISRPDFSVVVVSYNGADLLMLMLSSVKRALVGLSAEVFVVDNNSAEDVCHQVATQHPEVHLIAQSGNKGFGTANNIALRLASGRYVVILNPDTIVPHTFFHQLKEIMSASAGSGAIGVRMVNGNGLYLPESKRGYTTVRTSFFKLSGLWHLSPRSPILNAYYIGNEAETSVCTAPILSGACMVFTHELMDRVGMFDEAYFMYCEDNDLSWRMHNATSGNVYRGDVSLIHFKGQSTPRQKHIIDHFYKSMIYFARKFEYAHHNVFGRALIWTGIKTAHFFALVKCYVLRTLERRAQFYRPNHIFLVSNVEHHVSNYQTVNASDLSSLEISKSDAVVFDIDADLNVAIEYMRSHPRETTYGFFNPDNNNTIVFYNNRCYNINQ